MDFRLNQTKAGGLRSGMRVIPFKSEAKVLNWVKVEGSLLVTGSPGPKLKTSGFWVSCLGVVIVESQRWICGLWVFSQ